MQFLMINEEMDKILAQIMDAALKHPQAGGLAMSGLVEAVRKSIQSSEPVEVKSSPELEVVKDEAQSA